MMMSEIYSKGKLTSVCLSVADHWHPQRMACNTTE